MPMTTQEPAIPPGMLNTPFSALGPLAAILLVSVLFFTQCGGSDDKPRRTSAAPAAAGENAPAAGAPSQTRDAGPPPKELPLRPPPSDACVAEWCGKALGYASIIVDEGRRNTALPRRAWEIAVATAMQESALLNQASDKYEVTERFPYDKMGSDHDSVGLFQQRPDQGWGKPEELMDPHIAAQKFYNSLKDKIKGWDDWQSARLTDVAQRVQRSKYPEAYQKHESNAKKIVDLVLQYPYKGDDGTKATNNKWFVMFQCKNPKARSCKAMRWELAVPVIRNHDAFKAAFPKAELNDHLGNAPHQNDDPPEDHTPGSDSCINGLCNAQGWIYAQDFGNGDARDTGFDLNHFVHWLLDELRRDPNKYKEVKYIISTIPANKGTAYYGSMSRRNNWEPTGKNRTDHSGHVHISYMPGFERFESTIIADYIKAGGANIKLAAAPVSTGAAAGFRHF